MGTWLKNQITSFCTGVLDGFLDFFGIHSPSRVMRDQVGVMIARGLALGLDKGENTVRKTAAQLGTVIEDEISGVGFNEQMSDVSAQITRSIPMGGAAIVSSATGASSTGTSSCPIELSFNLSTELDGQTLARRQYKYVARENNLRGGSLVEVGVG